MSPTVITYYEAMGRWEPNARDRLERAALDLYLERGYERTTVAEIAKQAGVSERTFFRHFADKREVLFGGAGEMKEFLKNSIANSDVSRSPIDVVVDAFVGVGTYLQERQDFARKRQEIINANPDLREREQMKLATLSIMIAEQLRNRSVKEPAASLSAEAGVAVFKIAFERWVSESEKADLPHLIENSLEELKAVALGEGWSK